MSAAHSFGAARSPTRYQAGSRIRGSASASSLFGAACQPNGVPPTPAQTNSMPPTPALMSSTRANGTTQGTTFPGLLAVSPGWTQVSADVPTTPRENGSSPPAKGTDDELASLEKRIRVELADIVAEAMKPIEASCNKNTDDLLECIANQRAFLLRDKPLQETTRQQQGNPSVSEEITLREKGPALSDDRSNELSRAIETQSGDIEELKRQLRELQKRDADLYKLQSSFESHLQSQVTPGCQEALNCASSAREICESGLRRFRLELDEVRTSIATRGAVACAVGNGTTISAGKKPAPSDIRGDASFKHDVEKLRAELSDIAAKASDATRAGLDEVKRELWQELDKECVLRHQQMEGLGALQLQVVQAKLELLSGARGDVTMSTTGPESELQRALARKVEKVADYQLGGLAALQLEVSQAKLELAAAMDGLVFGGYLPEDEEAKHPACCDPVEGIQALQWQVAKAKLELADLSSESTGQDEASVSIIR